MAGDAFVTLSKAVADFIDKYISDRRIQQTLLFSIAIILIVYLMAAIFGRSFPVDLLLTLMYLICLGTIVLNFVCGYFPGLLAGSAAQRQRLAKASKSARRDFWWLFCAAITFSILFQAFPLPSPESWRFRTFYALFRSGLASTDKVLSEATANRQVSVANYRELRNVSFGTDFPGLRVSSDFSNAEITDWFSSLEALSQYQTITFKAGHHIDLRNELGPIKLAIGAREIVFEQGFTIDLGTADFILFAHSFRFHRNSLVRAFPRGEPQGDKHRPCCGRNGANAGNVLLLAKYINPASDKLTIDLRGQDGGHGEPGAVVPDQTEVHARSNEIARSDPVLMTQDDFRKAEEEIARRDVAVRDELKRQLEDLRKRCTVDDKIVCIRYLCRDTHLSVGKQGMKGARAKSGGQGGRGGNGGYILLLVSNDGIADRFFENAERGSLRPHSQPTSSGGNQGESGPRGRGGPGGFGLEPDVTGACPPSVQGPFGPLGDEAENNGDSKKGRPGDPPKATVRTFHFR